MRLRVLVSLAAAVLLTPAAARAQTITTTTLSSAPASPEVNQSVTLTATVSTGTGTVVFLDGNTTITGCGAQPLDVTGTATCQTAFSTLGSHALTAAYIPDANAFAPSSGFLPLSVRSPSVAVLYPAAAVVGQPVTYTVLVAPGWSDPTLPTGTVQFLDGGVAIGACASQTLSPSGAFATASCTTRYTTTGTLTIAADYGGDGGFVGAISNGQSVSVSPAPTTTTLTRSSGAPAVGQAVTVTATVKPNTGPGQPTTTVTFADNGTPIDGCAAQSSAGAAACTVSYAAAVVHTITATYAGDANFDSSSAAPLAIDVGPAQSPAIGALTLRASRITTTGALLTGRLTASDAPLGWQFEYGPRAPLTKATPLRTIAAGRAALAVSLVFSSSDLPRPTRSRSSRSRRAAAPPTRRSGRTCRLRPSRSGRCG